MNKWISVEDRLPKDRVDVLFCEKWCDVPGIGWYVYERKEWVANKDFVMSFDGGVDTNIDQKDVTHWMPLPDLPKEDWKRLDIT